MNELVQELDWDSQFFSVGIGRILPAVLDEPSAQAALEQARRLGLRCLYFEGDPADVQTVQTAEKHRFHLVDVRVTLEYLFNGGPDPFRKSGAAPDIVVNEAREADLPKLEEITVEISRMSRFASDANFGLSQAERLYRVWIQNSMHGFADMVFVARWRDEDAEPVGLITCKAGRGINHIDLLGVHHEYRRKGAGAALIQAGLEWSSRQGAPALEVVTQARNVGAQRLYQQMGFVNKSMNLFYHVWL